MDEVQASISLVDIALRRISSLLTIYDDNITGT
jgi:hypothetical protein